MADHTDNPSDETVEVPSLSTLSTEELAAAEEYLVEQYQSIRAQVELSADDVSELREIAEAIETVRAEASSRAELAALDSFVASSSVEELTAEETEDETEEAEEAEAVEAEEAEAPAEEAPAADASDNNTNPEAEAPADAEFTAEEQNDVSETLSPSGLKGDTPTPSEEAPALVASIGADVPGYQSGQEVIGTFNIAKALIEKKKRIRGSAEAGSVYDIVASIHGDFPEDRILGDDAVKNTRLIDQVTSVEAIVAAGGICNQLTPYYPLITLGDVDRPVRDALPTFKADRGGIRYNGAPTLADITVATTDTGTSGAIRITTEDADANGYDYHAVNAPDDAAPKPCLHVSCKPEATAVVDAISRCLKFGNFGARTYPEQVEAWTKLSLVQQARVAEQKILAEIAAQSTAVTRTAKYSATRTILSAVDVAVAAYKSRHRIAKAVKLRALFPEWVKNLIRVDLANSHEAPVWSVTDAQISDWFSARGIVPTYYLDSRTTNPNMVFGTQSAGALLEFPATVEWYLFADGSFLHLDGGSLDLGVVRDSTLNSQNDFSIFAESWETVAFVGVESLKVVSDICPTGSGAVASSVITCS